jgi:membrane fusion protein (multidrug efflux system)
MGRVRVGPCEAARAPAVAAFLSDPEERFRDKEYYVVLDDERPADADGRSDESMRAESRPDAVAETLDRHEADPREDGESEAADESRDRGEPKREGLRGFVRRHRLASAVALSAAVAIIVGACLWWLQARHYEDTDDAFIDGRPVAISAEVAGAIVEVPVTDNQLVEAGAVLLRIDDRDYTASLAQAEAQAQQAQGSIDNFQAQIEAQRARIDQTAKQVVEAQAALDFAQAENTRYQDLVRQGAGTVQRAQQARSDLQQKQAALDAAKAAQAEAQKQIGVLRAQRLSAQAQLAQAHAQGDQARANLSRVTIRAPVAGRATKLTGAAGAYAVPGQTLMMLVPQDLWVTANFKETQLAGMQPGQPVTIEIDAYGRSFSGHVDSIQAGSGTAFSLLPAENATGNFVKVVQRVPVKIVFDARPDVELGPGMSVVPSVKVR